MTVNYTWTPEAEDGENPEPVTKSASVEISLEAVRLESLVVTELPYRVYYGDDMAFDPEGMSAEARYNDGSVVVLSAEDIESPSEILTAGTGESTCIMVGRQRRNFGGRSRYRCPRRVHTSTTATILSIKAEGEVYLAEGAELSSARPVVRADV